MDRRLQEIVDEIIQVHLEQEQREYDAQVEAELDQRERNPEGLTDLEVTVCYFNPQLP